MRDKIGQGHLGYFPYRGTYRYRPLWMVLLCAFVKFVGMAILVWGGMLACYWWAVTR